MSGNRRRGSWGRGLLMAAALAGACVLACSTDHEAADYDNPYDPSHAADIPTPDSVRVAVSDGKVTLTWRLPRGETADEFAIFRKAPDDQAAPEERLLDKTAERTYTDTRVRNGRLYLYRIAAGREGNFGARTEEVEARPGVYSILLAEDRALTKDRSVSITANAENAKSARFSEVADRFESPWHAVSGSLKWDLSEGDGVKTVWGQFLFEDGSRSLPVSDSITLDTKAAISSVSFDGSESRRPGDVVHFRLVAGEPRGVASVSIDGVLDKGPLFDDGTGGDLVAEDGVYEGDHVLFANEPVTRAQVKGTFADEAGNVAAAAIAPRSITLRPPVEAVALLGADLAEPPDPASVTLHWSPYEEDGFASYRIFRGESATVDSTDRLVTAVQDSKTLSAEDASVIESRTYYYRVYVLDTSGEQAGSNPLRVEIANRRPPSAVNIESGAATGTTRIAVQWSRSQDADFGAYRLYRSESGAVDENDALLVTARELAQTMFVDTGLVENETYHYRVYVSDAGDLRVPGNEVEVRTENEPPPAVVLNEGTDVDTAAVTLSWGRSAVHDFAKYTIFRDEVPTVTTGSTEVVTIDEPGGTSFRDRELDKGKRYYYRVFVFDDAPEAESTGSNTITILTSR